MKNKTHTGYAAIMGGKIVQIFTKDLRKDKIGKQLMELSEMAAILTDKKFEIKKFTFRV